LANNLEQEDLMVPGEKREVMPVKNALSYLMTITEFNYV